MSKKENEVTKTDSGDVKKSSKINDGCCCRCTKRCDKMCKITGKYVARKHKCDAKMKNGKLGFSYDD